MGRGGGGEGQKGGSPDFGFRGGGGGGGSAEERVSRF